MGMEYLRSGPGILNLLQELFNVIGLSVVAAGDVKNSRGDAFLACSILALIITLVFLLIQTMGFHDTIPAMLWSRTLIGYCFAWTLFYLIVSSLLLDGITIISIKFRPDEYTAAGSIGIITTVLYLIEGIFRVVIKI